jgi:hypothetical protein
MVGARCSGDRWADCWLRRALWLRTHPWAQYSGGAGGDSIWQEPRPTRRRGAKTAFLGGGGQRRRTVWRGRAYHHDGWRGGLLKSRAFTLTAHERRMLLVGGAAGMAVPFNPLIGAILLSVALLWFELKPRSLIPVALARSPLL